MDKKKTNEYSSARILFESLSDEDRKKLTRLYEDNLPHIRAKELLIAAIKSSIDNPVMTSELKEIGQLFILLLAETGNSFKYDVDEVLKPVEKIVEADTKSQSGKHAIETRHSKPGGAREKREGLRKIWAEGNYLTREACAEAERHKFNYSFEGAKKALRNTVDPFPWPAKEKRKQKK